MREGNDDDAPEETRGKCRCKYVYLCFYIVDTESWCIVPDPKLAIDEADITIISQVTTPLSPLYRFSGTLSATRSSRFYAGFSQTILIPLIGFMQHRMKLKAFIDKAWREVSADVAIRGA